MSSNLIKDIEPGKEAAHIDMSVTYPTKINHAKASLQLTWNYDGSIKVFDIYFFEYLNNPNSSATPPLKKGEVSFWTNWKKAIGTKIYIEDEYIGTFYGYFTDGEPNCEQEGTVTYENKAGKYSFKAYSKKKGNWAGTIEIKEEDCSTILLGE